MYYNVEILEKLTKRVLVEAEDEKSAVEQLAKEYFKGTTTLDRDDNFNDVEFKIVIEL